VTRADGRAYAPDDAWRHADEAFDRTQRGFEYGYFHTRGTADLTVPEERCGSRCGTDRNTAWRRADVKVSAGRTVTERLVLERVADLPARGWWSGDLHVHMNYGGAYRTPRSTSPSRCATRNLHVIENLS